MLAKFLQLKPRNLALLLACIIAVWVASGWVIPSDQEEEVDVSEQIEAKKRENVTVKVTPMRAEEKTRSVVLNGVTEPRRITLVEAQTEGTIEKIHVKEGETVQAGAVILEIEKRDRPERLAEAKAVVRQRSLEYSAAKKLKEQGYQSEVRLAQARAQLEAAKRNLKQAELDYSFTTVTAPYEGRVERLMVEAGDLAGRGMAKQTVLEFVDLNPLIIRGQLAEQDVDKIRQDLTADIRLVDGRQLQGVVSYIARVADEDTRTFRVEVEVPNPDGAIPAGISAEISLPAETLPSYQVSASVLTLDDAGKVGVKLADEQGLIHFVPVNIMSQSAQGVWISGLPDMIRLVTVGSNFISPGQTVDLEKVMQPDTSEVPANTAADALSTPVTPASE